MEEITGPDPGRASTEYLRKLSQQIIQKDSIIKLLNLKLKNLEEENEGLRKDTKKATSRSRSRKTESPDRKLKKLQDSEARLKKQLDEASKAAAHAEDQLAAALESLEEKSALLERCQAELASLRDGPGRHKNDELWAQVTSLRDALEEKERTVARLQEDLAMASPGGAPSRELARLEEQCEALMRDKARLESVIADLKEGATPERGFLAEDLEQKEGELAEALASKDRLAREVARLEERLQQAKERAEAQAPPDSFQLVQALIGLFERIDSLPVPPSSATPTGSYDVSALEGSVREISRFIGIQRIPTVGQPYDDERHQAVEVVYSTEHPHNTIIRELSHGYEAQSGVVKVADVIVSRNPFFCPRCERVTAEGSRYCNICGNRLLGHEAPDLKVLTAEENTRSTLDLALAQERVRNFEAAERNYLRVVEMDARSVDAWWGLTRVREQAGHFHEALVSLDRLEEVTGPYSDSDRARHRIRMKIEILERVRDL